MTARSAREESCARDLPLLPTTHGARYSLESPRVFNNGNHKRDCTFVENMAEGVVGVGLVSTSAVAVG